MFGRHPCLAIDVFLGLTAQEERKSYQDYADRLQERLNNAYRRASEDALKKGKKYKKYYDQKVKHIVLLPGDRVLMEKVGIQGKHKLADLWESNTYIVISQPMPDIPVYEVKEENVSLNKNQKEESRKRKKERKNRKKTQIQVIQTQNQR